MTHQKVVIITGAGSGMGYAVTRKFARDGFKVVLNGWTEGKLNKVASEVGMENCLFVCLR